MSYKTLKWDIYRTKTYLVTLFYSKCHSGFYNKSGGKYVSYDTYNFAK